MSTVAVTRSAGRVKAADREVLDRPRRLDAVVGVRRDRALAERIVLDAGQWGRESFVEDGPDTKAVYTENPQQTTPDPFAQIILIECLQRFSTAWSRWSFGPPPIFHLMCARR